MPISNEIKTYGGYKAGTSVTIRPTDGSKKKIVATVCATNELPPNKKKNPVCVVTNSVFWIEADQIVSCKLPSQQVKQID
jgi:hypothetical protein